MHLIPLVCILTMVAFVVPGGFSWDAGGTLETTSRTPGFGPSSPNRGAFPSILDVFVFDPSDPPIDPDAGYDKQRDNLPNQIRGEINEMERDQRENGTD